MRASIGVLAVVALVASMPIVEVVHAGEPPMVWMMGYKYSEAGDDSYAPPIYRFTAGYEPGEAIGAVEIENYNSLAMNPPHGLAFVEGGQLLLAGWSMVPVSIPVYGEDVLLSHGPPFSVSFGTGYVCGHSGFYLGGNPGVDAEDGFLWYSSFRHLFRCERPSDGSLPWSGPQDFELPPGRRGEQALAILGGKAYVSLRDYSSGERTLSVFDPAEEQFSVLGALPEEGDLYLDFDHLGRLWIAQFVGGPPGPGEQPPPGELTFWRVDNVENYYLAFVSTVASPAVTGLAIGPPSVLEVPGLGEFGWLVLSLLIAAGGTLLVVRSGG